MGHVQGMATGAKSDPFLTANREMRALVLQLQGNEL